MDKQLEQTEEVKPRNTETYFEMIDDLHQEIIQHSGRTKSGKTKKSEGWN